MSETSHLLIFRIARKSYAIPAHSVREIIHKRELIPVPGQPAVLGGFLQLRKSAIPVINLRYIFGLDAGVLGMYTPLIVIQANGIEAVLEVDAVSTVVEVSADAYRPLAEASSPNDCAEALVAIEGENVILLSCGRLLLRQEEACLQELQSGVQQRLEALGSSIPLDPSTE